MAEVDVEALASAFNIDKADFMGRVITIDEFDNPEIQAVICDESWLQIYDSIFTMKTFENGRTLSWKYMLHSWQSYAICPFANAVCLATAEPKPATAISVADTSVVVDATATPTVTLTPADATTDLRYSSSDETVFTVSELGVVTGVSAGTGTLTVYTDNGLSATATITVTSGE